MHSTSKKPEFIWIWISQILEYVLLYGERYQDAVLKGVYINIYYIGKESFKELTFTQVSHDEMIRNIIKEMNAEIGNLPEVKSLKSKKARISTTITAIKGDDQKECCPFIVADIERVLFHNVNFLMPPVS